MQTRLRTARTEETQAILDLMVQTIDASIEPAHRAETVANVTRNLTAWKRDPDQSFHFVAEHEGRIVGVILVKAFWNLCSLFVAPAWQRHGIGRRLVLTAIDACRDKSPKQAIHLNAAPSALPFYAALRFASRASSQPLPAGFQAMQLALVPAAPRTPKSNTRP